MPDKKKKFWEHGDHTHTSEEQLSAEEIATVVEAIANKEIEGMMFIAYKFRDSDKPTSFILSHRIDKITSVGLLEIAKAGLVEASASYYKGDLRDE